MTAPILTAAQALEAAAKWHEQQSNNAMSALSSGSNNGEFHDAYLQADVHKEAAVEMRRLSASIPAPAQDGVVGQRAETAAALQQAADRCHVWHVKACERAEVATDETENMRHESCASTSGSLASEIRRMITPTGTEALARIVAEAEARGREAAKERAGMAADADLADRLLSYVEYNDSLQQHQKADIIAAARALSTPTPEPIAAAARVLLNSVPYQAGGVLLEAMQAILQTDQTADLFAAWTAALTAIAAEQPGVPR